MQIICVFTLIAGIVFGGPRPRTKAEIRTDIMKRVEPDYRRGTPSNRDNCAHAIPQNPNTVTTVIDSSTNGYGMVHGINAVPLQTDHPSTTWAGMMPGNKGLDPGN